MYQHCILGFSNVNHRKRESFDPERSVQLFGVEATQVMPL